MPQNFQCKFVLKPHKFVSKSKLLFTYVLGKITSNYLIYNGKLQHYR